MMKRVPHFKVIVLFKSIKSFIYVAPSIIYRTEILKEGTFLDILVFTDLTGPNTFVECYNYILLTFTYIEDESSSFHCHLSVFSN